MIMMRMPVRRSALISSGANTRSGPSSVMRRRASAVNPQTFSIPEKIPYATEEEGYERGEPDDSTNRCSGETPPRRDRGR